MQNKLQRTFGGKFSVFGIVEVEFLNGQEQVKQRHIVAHLVYSKHAHFIPNEYFRKWLIIALII